MIFYVGNIIKFLVYLLLKLVVVQMSRFILEISRLAGSLVFRKRRYLRGKQDFFIVEKKWQTKSSRHRKSKYDPSKVRSNEFRLLMPWWCESHHATKSRKLVCDAYIFRNKRLFLSEESERRQILCFIFCSQRFLFF